MCQLGHLCTVHLFFQHRCMQIEIKLGGEMANGACISDGETWEQPNSLAWYSRRLRSPCLCSGFPTKENCCRSHPVCMSQQVPSWGVWSRRTAGHSTTQAHRSHYNEREMIREIYWTTPIPENSLSVLLMCIRQRKKKHKSKSLSEVSAIPPE